MATWYTCVGDFVSVFDVLGNGPLRVLELVAIIRILIRFLYILLLVLRPLLSLFVIIKIR